MANLYTEYASYPGRQIRYMVVPRMYAPVFFEGVQSADFASNANEVNHGQFGTKSDVIVARDYQNTSGTFNLKEFNNASYVLRAMMGVDPSKSFLFDASRMEHVDVYGNVYNKARTEVLRSTWLVDFVPSVSESESLDDIQTKDIAYTAIRKLDFEGYQIFCQTFAGDEPNWIPSGGSYNPFKECGQGAPKGAMRFRLKYPALIDPTYDKVDLTPRGAVHGKERHELCPIQYALRVWIDGQIVEDPAEAAIVTSVLTGTGEPYSTLVLKNPLSGDVDNPSDNPEHIVKVMWLIDGKTKVEQTSVTTAPVMVSANAELDTTGTSPTWQHKLHVFLSKAVVNTIGGNPDMPPLTDFGLSINGAAEVNPTDMYFVDSSEAMNSIVSNAVAGGTIPDSIAKMQSYNILTLEFDSGVSYTQGQEAALSYKALSNVLKDYDGMDATQHVIQLPVW